MLHGRTERVPVDRERAAGRYFVRIAAGKDERAAAPHFFMQQTDRVVFGIVGAKRVRAHQFREAVGQVRVGLPHRAHFVQDDGNIHARKLPRSF